MIARTADRPAGGTLAVAAAIAGNTLEWFDFTVYGFFATFIGFWLFLNAVIIEQRKAD